MTWTQFIASYWMLLLLGAIIAYLLGSFNFAIIITKVMKKGDIRDCGSGNAECSGNVTRENIARLRDIGIDYVSSGALTHSAPILDLSMKHLRPLTAEEA